ncbi:MAG: GNAT family N-acetyltransferase [Oscillospiraceae bacterium]|nr:GNAT family N-acetyltransferase [Oscillospiraceae bacterium]
MKIRKFEKEKDLEELEKYLREQYSENRTPVTWIPERLHDLIYRVSAQETDDGREISAENIYLWGEYGVIEGCILPDGENIYFSVKKGYETLFPLMVAFSEKHCQKMFGRASDGSVKFWIASCNSLDYQTDVLKKAGYTRISDEECWNCIDPQEMTSPILLPRGYRLMYEDDCSDEEKKWSALRLSFHPEWEAADYRAPMGPYNMRKESSMYEDSFECLIADDYSDERNDICSYCFVYVDTPTATAMIEPVGTREKYMHKGLGMALLRAAVLRCREAGIRKCYVDSFGWRREFYRKAGFKCEESFGFWYKVIMPDNTQDQPVRSAVFS